MNQAAVEEFVSSLANVEQETNYGYTFFFVGDDHRLPFVTMSDADNDYDKLSNLNREGVFCVNIGVSKKTFEAMLGDYDAEMMDYSLLDVFLPHPDYAKQHFLRILSPSQANEAKTKDLIREAHSIATTRLTRKQTGSS